MITISIIFILHAFNKVRDASCENHHTYGCVRIEISIKRILRSLLFLIQTLFKETL